MKLFAAVPVLLILCIAAAFAVPAEWNEDFRHQPLKARPAIEARYTDATRTAAVIEADNYTLRADLKSLNGQRVSLLSVKDQKGRGSDILTGQGIYLTATAADGTSYTSINSRQASRINIYRRGPYYIETHWLDVSLTDAKGRRAPIRGEVVFYSYPEKTHVAAILHVTDDFEVREAQVVCDLRAARMDRVPSDTSEDCQYLTLAQRAKSPSVAVLYPVEGGVDDTYTLPVRGGISIYSCVYSSRMHRDGAAQWKAGDKPAAYFELFPLRSGAPDEALRAEIAPLPQSSISASSGKLLGYDPIRGCYTVRTDTPGGFNYHYYEDKNAYEVAALSIRNGSLPRKIYILHDTAENPGSVECGAVLDSDGYRLPVTVQISKNFAGEREEKFYNPNDTPFSETIFPVYLKPDETRALTSLHLYQNWGVHPLKQFSSLGAWMDYYHMSTGVTETTCYVPFLFAGLPGVSIADLRPMSQRMWGSQPQHDNVAGHSFLRYQDEAGKWHYSEYTGTTFRSTGPNWADMTMNYLSDDGKARLKLDVFELPQADELRNFMHMRVDFLDDISVKDDNLARNLVLLNIASWVQGLRYTKVACGGPAGLPVVTDIALDDTFTLTGHSIPSRNGFAVEYPEQRGANAFIVRSFRGSIGGESVGAGVTMLGQKNGDTNFQLVPVTQAREIKKGDYLDVELFIMPYGGGTQDWKPAQKAAYDYGVNSPRVTGVAAGRKLADFPTRIALNSRGRAEFKVTGGLDVIPIIVEGTSDYRSLRIYNADSGKQIIEHSRPGQTDGYQTFVTDDGNFGSVFVVTTDGKEHKYIVEQVPLH